MFLILKVSDGDRVNHIDTQAMSEGEGDPGLTVVAIWRLMEALGNVAAACRRASPAPYQTICNSYNLDAPAHSLDHLKESADSLRRHFDKGWW